MSFLKEIKFTSVLIGLLLVLNVVCIYFLALHHKILSDRPQKEPFEKHMRSRNEPNVDRAHSLRFLTKALQLSDDQTAEIHELRKGFMMASGKIRKSIKEDRIALFNTPTKDSLIVKEKIVGIGKQQEKLEWLLFNHFNTIRGICTEKQKERYDQIIEKVIGKFGPLEPRHKKRSKKRPKKKKKHKG